MLLCKSCASVLVTKRILYCSLLIEHYKHFVHLAVILLLFLRCPVWMRSSESEVISHCSVFFLIYEHLWPTFFTHCFPPLVLILLQQEVCLCEWQATCCWDTVIPVQFSPRSHDNLRNRSQVPMKHVHCRTQWVKKKSLLSPFLIYTLIASFDPSPQL